MRRLHLLAILVAGAAACAPVRPWQREHLSRRSMDVAAGSQLATQHRAKTVESTTAGGLPGDAPGGGCGCTQ